MAIQYLGIAPDDEQLRIYVLLTYAYQGNFEKARRLWYRYKKVLLNSGNTFTDQLLIEINQLLAEGLNPGPLTKLRRLIRV